MMTLDSELKEKVGFLSPGEALTLPIISLGLDYPAKLREILTYTSSLGLNVLVVADREYVYIHCGLRLISGEENA